ncbi:hypothetical protein ZWY2020_006664 [Hordeum vulgare]|nr:hypothetical protein ZWY2020_006664 [Hordeum vulgare]
MGRHARMRLQDQGTAARLPRSAMPLPGSLCSLGVAGDCARGSRPPLSRITPRASLPWKHSRQDLEIVVRCLPLGTDPSSAETHKFATLARGPVIWSASAQLAVQKPQPRSCLLPLLLHLRALESLLHRHRLLVLDPPTPTLPLTGSHPVPEAKMAGGNIPGAAHRRPATSTCSVVSTPEMEDEAYRLRTTALLLTTMVQLLLLKEVAAAICVQLGFIKREADFNDSTLLAYLNFFREPMPMENVAKLVHIAGLSSPSQLHLLEAELQAILDELPVRAV